MAGAEAGAAMTVLGWEDEDTAVTVLGWEDEARCNDCTGLGR